jgi:CBS-domain-containing membrane protein
MSATVREFMNSQMVYINDRTRPEIALQSILDFGITAVPVLDDDERPVGVVSLRDLVNPRKEGMRVTESVATVGVGEPIEVAARRLAEAGVHHLVVLDVAGRAVGMLSAVDIVRALMGLQPKHPQAIDGVGRKGDVLAGDQTLNTSQ